MITSKKKLVLYVVLIHALFLLFLQMNITKNKQPKKKIIVHTKVQPQIINNLPPTPKTVQAVSKPSPVKKKPPPKKKKIKAKPNKTKNKKKPIEQKKVRPKLVIPKTQVKKEIVAPITEILTREKLADIIDVLQTHLVLPTQGNTTLLITINNQGKIDEIKPIKHENGDNLHYLLNLVPHLPLKWPQETYNTTFTFTFES